MRDAVALTIAAAIPAIAGGLIYKAVHSSTGTGRAVATGFWIAAAACLVLMVLAGRKSLWRRTSRPLPEGWVFVTAAFVLTALGAAIDAAA